MPAWLVMVTMGSVLGVFEIEAKDVRVEVMIQSHNYFVRLTNLGHSPITTFEMGERAGYMFTVPEGWARPEIGHRKRGVFEAFAQEPGAAIRPRASKSFCVRVSGEGPVLGWVPVEVGFASGETVVIPECWGPVAEPPQTVYLVPVVLLAIFVVHAGLVAWRDRRNPQLGLSGL